MRFSYQNRKLMTTGFRRPLVKKRRHGIDERDRTEASLSRQLHCVVAEGRRAGDAPGRWVGGAKREDPHWEQKDVLTKTRHWN